MRLFRFLPAAVLGALVLAAGASAGTPRFALFSVHRDLAGASHNVFGDVKVWKRHAALASRTPGATLVRCGGDCSYGAGWLAFVGRPAIAPADVRTATAKHTRSGWSVVATLTTHGTASFARFRRLTALSGRTRGVPDALVIVLNGAIVAQPLANQIRAGRSSVEFPGLSRANALRAAKLLTR